MWAVLDRRRCNYDISVSHERTTDWDRLEQLKANRLAGVVVGVGDILLTLAGHNNNGKLKANNLSLVDILYTFTAACNVGVKLNLTFIAGYCLLIV